MLVNRSSLLNEGAGPEQMEEAVTGAGLVSAEAVAVVAARAGRVARAGEKDEQGSGMLGGETAAAPAVEEEVGVAAPPQLSPDSAETELLLPSNPRREEAALPPPPPSPVSDEEVVGGEEEPEAEPTNPPWLVAGDTSVFDLDPRLLTTTPPPPGAVNPSHPDVLHVDFFDQLGRGVGGGGGGGDLAPPSPSSLAHELQGGDPTSWAMPDNYDYLTPYDEGASPTADEYSYSTTTETYDSAEDPRPAPGRPRPRPRAPEDKAPPRLPGAAAESPDTVPRVPAVYAVDGSDGLGGCRVGYQMLNGSCRSPCDSLVNYCFNGGQCYLIEGQGALCR